MTLIEKLKKPKTKHTTETKRVVGLPVGSLDKTENIRDLTVDFRKPRGRYQLRPVQSAALHFMRQNNGLLGPIGVGHGKSIIALLAGTALDCSVAVIVAPASTCHQLQATKMDMERHFRLPKTCLIYSYATISQPKNTALLDTLAKKYGAKNMCLVADEAHKLKSLDSARTKRLIRFFQANPEVRFVALSGTLTSKSLKDFGHLAELALRDGSPLPFDRHHMDAWCECIDVGGRPNQAHWQVIEPLWRWYQARNPKIGSMYQVRGQQRQKIIREAFRERLWATPGVVATGKGSLGCSLNLTKQSDIDVPREVTEALHALAGEDMLPNGEFIEDDVAMWRAGRYLCQGFFYRWAWELTPAGEEDREWLEARRTWFRQVRAELRYASAEGYDSAFLVFTRIKREYDRGKRLAIHRAWKAWDEQRQKPVPPTVPVWVSEYLVDWVCDWASRQKKKVIVWYDTLAFGEALKSRGMKVYGANEQPPSNRAETCAMSIQAHGVGKNLQKWDNQLIVSPPSSGKTWEQLLGRTHRQGQDSDEVSCTILHHAPPFSDAMEKAMLDASYIESTSGNKQKLLFATWTGE